MFCTQCGVRAMAPSRFCGQCGARLPVPVPAPEAPAREISRRQMTVLFCDLVGSTTLAEALDAEDLFEALRAYHTLVKRIAVRFNGHVAKVVGDGVDVYFGYPMANEDDAVRAIHAGLAIVEGIGSLAGPDGKPYGLGVRVGLATGRVTVGQTDTLAIAGATPNLAARIQAEAQPGQVLVSPVTRRIAGPQFDYDDLGPVALKGFADPVRLSAVAGVKGFNSRSAWRGRDGALPMIGRERELARLRQAWEACRHGPGEAVLVMGEAGLGKSRLATALAESLHDEPHLVIRLQCSPFHTNSVLYPFVQHLMAAAGFARHDSPQAQIEKLEAQLAIAGISEPQDLALMASLLDIPVDGRYPPLEMPPPARLQLAGELLVRYFAELTSQVPMVSTEALLALYFRGVTRSKPLLIVFDDLHWIDPSSLELLDKLLSTARLQHALFVLTARPGFEHRFPPQARVPTVELRRLDAGQSRQMVAQLCHAIDLPASSVDLILSKTDGIPLFIEEMTRMVQDMQGVRSGLGLGSAGLGVPDTLLDLLTERLDRLGPAKALAQAAAALGQTFPTDLLAAVAQLPATTFEDQLNRLLASGLLLPHGPGQLKFKHALVENTAYDTTLLKTRVALHGRVVECLQGEFAALAQGAPELLAHHLARANRALEAARYLLQAGVQSLQGGAPREAAEHLKAGLQALQGVAEGPARAEVELGLLSVLGPTTMVLMGPGSAQFGEVQKRAYALCQSLPGKPRQFPITYGLCLYHWGRAEFDQALPLAQQLLHTANAIERGELDLGVAPHEAVMAACNMNGMIAFHRGESVQALAHLQRSVSLYQPERDAALYPVYLMDFGIFGRFYLALAHMACGEAEAAQQHALDAYTLAQRLNQPHSLGFSMLANFNIAVMRQEPEVALRFAEQCVGFSTQFGFPEFIGMARIVRGWATARRGQPEQGLADLEEGVRLWQSTGFENWQTWFVCLKAEILAELGRREQAVLEIDEQLERIQRNQERQFLPQLQRWRAALATG